MNFVAARARELNWLFCLVALRDAEVRMYPGPARLSVVPAAVTGDTHTHSLSLSLSLSLSHTHTHTHKKCRNPNVRGSGAPVELPAETTCSHICAHRLHPCPMCVCVCVCVCVYVYVCVRAWVNVCYILPQLRWISFFILHCMNDEQT